MQEVHQEPLDEEFLVFRQVFSGKMKGKVIEEVRNKDADIMPYMRIFVPDGFEKTMSELTDEELFPIMHRPIALKKMAAVISNE